ncbi:MAG: chromosome segregation protein [Sciscionella sp.]
MSLADDRDLVPLGTGFDIVKRGYSRTQVEEHLERLDADLRLLAADRDAAVSQGADLAKQLEQQRSEISDLNAQIDRLSLPPTTLEGLSERLQRMLRLAQDEAAEIKARAEAEAGHIRARAEADATVLRGHYEQRITDLDNRRAEMEVEHRGVLTKAHAKMAELSQRAKDERARADDEAEQRRTQIEEDFEIAMSSRRTEAMRALAEQEAHSKAEAERRVRVATEEAARISNDITARDRRSKDEAERRVREATEDAIRRRERSTAETTQRINAAAARVESLRRLRTQIANQLYTARDLLAHSVPNLDPLPDEESEAPQAETPQGTKLPHGEQTTQTLHPASPPQTAAASPAAKPQPEGKHEKPAAPVHVREPSPNKR